MQAELWPDFKSARVAPPPSVTNTLTGAPPAAAAPGLPQQNEDWRSQRAPGGQVAAGGQASKGTRWLAGVQSTLC